MIFSSSDPPEPKNIAMSIRAALLKAKLPGRTSEAVIEGKFSGSIVTQLTIPKDADPAPYEAIIAPHNEGRQRVVLVVHASASSTEPPFVK